MTHKSHLSMGAFGSVVEDTNRATPLNKPNNFTDVVLCLRMR